MSTAAVVIIGDEILSGKFADENGPFFIARLRALGVRLARIVTIPDDIDVIAAEVRAASDAFDHVFTSGGVGPTHDDVTLEGIARAFDRPLTTHPDLVAVMRRFDIPLDDANLRMARVPKGTVLVADPAMHYPMVLVENVWVFPGIPKLLRRKFNAIAHRFSGPTLHLARVYTDELETAIAVRLTAVDAAHPSVAIGSYPRFGEGDFRVIVTLEATDADALEAARAAVAACVHVVPAPSSP